MRGLPSPGEVGRGRRPRAALALAAALTAAALGCSPDPADSGDAAPGAPARAASPVVLISIDTLRPDHLTSYGYERDTSPFLARLATRGVQFERAYAQAPCTAPSHMSLMTGIVPEAHGVQQWRPEGNRRLSPAIPTLASLLAERGYRTEAYTGGGNVRPELGFDVGFDVYETDGSDITTTIDKAVDALDRLARDDRPFLLFVHTFAVHDPYLPPDELREHFAARPYDGDVLGSARHLAEATGGDWSRRAEVFWDAVDADDPADVQRLVDLYDACIVHMDREIGRLFAALDVHDLLTRSAVVFTSDHGEEFLEHGGFTHNTNYQELLHVPLIMSMPGADYDARRGTRESTLVRSIDVVPTLLEHLGLAMPEHLQGRSLRPLLIEGAGRDADVVLSQWLRGRNHALRVGDVKLIARYPRGGEPVHELYDLAVDPGEQHDLALERPELLARMIERLEALRASSRAMFEGSAEGADVELDAATREQLQGLGYLGR